LPVFSTSAENNKAMVSHFAMTAPKSEQK